MAQKQEKDKGKNTESIDDVKDLSKIIALSTKSMKKVQSVIVNHIKMISEVVTTMNDIASKDKGLQLLLEPDSIPEVDEKTGKITYKSDKSPQIIRIVDNVTKVISNIPKTIEAIAKMDLGWRSMRKIKKNMIKIPYILRGIFGTLTQELKSVLDNDTINLFKLLQGEGDVTTKDISYDNQGNIIFDGDKKAVMKEVAKKGKMSILDVFLKTFDLFDRIEKMSESISVYVDGVYEAAKANYQLKEGIPKTTDEYIAMREAILKGDDIKGLSIDTKMGILNTLDSEYGQLFDLTSVEAQARKLVGIIKHYGDGTKDGTNEIGTMETFLNMRTAVNNDECTVGDYLSQFDKINDITKGWSEEEKKTLNTAFGLDTDSIVGQYNALKEKLQIVQNKEIEEKKRRLWKGRAKDEK